MPNDISGVSQAGYRDQAATAPPGAVATSAPGPSAPAASAVPAQAVQEQAVKPDAEAVKKAAESINEFIKSSSRNLDISVDKETGIVVVKVVDKETGDVIRQIPGDETLAIAKNLDSVQGVLIRSKA